MALYSEDLNLNIEKNGKLKGNVTRVVLRQYEYDGTQINATVYDGAEPLDLSGYSAVFWMRNPKNSTVEAPAKVVDAKAGKVSVTVTNDMTAEHGPVSVAYFELLNGSSSVTTDNIPITIERSADLSSDEVRRYQTKLDEMVEEWTERTKNFRDIDRIVTTYQEGTSTTTPTGTWTSAMPTVGQGRYLWRRDVIYLTDGTTHTVYMYARQGQDNTTWGAATTTKDGLMSASDKKRLDAINDVTTGINLLRGSRDFATGTVTYGTKDKLTLDGCAQSTNSSFSVTTRADGYGVLHYNGKSGSTAYRFLNVLLPEQVNGHTLTISFEYMVESETAENGMLFNLRKMSLDDTPSTTLKTFYYADAGLSNPAKNVWHKVVLHYDTVLNLGPNEYLSPGITLAPSADLTRVVNYTMPKIEIDHIENTAWSDSPQDLALATKAISEMDVKAKVTPREGCTLNTARIKVADGMMAQLYLSITTNEKFNAGTSYVVCNLDDSILPADIITPAASSTNGFGCINKTNKNLEIRMLSDLDSGKTMYIGAAYVLNKSLSPIATIPNLSGTLVGAVPSGDGGSPSASPMPLPGGSDVAIVHPEDE